MSRLRPFPIYLVASLAILAFSAFLAFALIRLFQVENDMRDNVDENMLWVVTQAQVASHRLDQAVSRRALGHRDEDPELRLDILSSRLTLMDDGPQRRYLASQGLEAPLNAALDDLQALLTTVDDIKGEARFRPDTLMPHLDNLMTRLNRIANAVMMAEWESTGARLDTYRSSLLQVIGSVVGITLSGLALVLLLVHALRQRRLAQRALTAHRDQLEGEVARHISRYKETADALARALNRERGVSEFYRSFAAMVSHQFRTPLAVIDSGLQRLLRRNRHFTAEQRKSTLHRRATQRALSAAARSGGTDDSPGRVVADRGATRWPASRGPADPPFAGVHRRSPLPPSGRGERRRTVDHDAWQP